MGNLIAAIILGGGLQIGFLVIELVSPMTDPPQVEQFQVRMASRRPEEGSTPKRIRACEAPAR
jgi:hypothetical protein